MPYSKWQKKITDTLQIRKIFPVEKPLLVVRQAHWWHNALCWKQVPWTWDKDRPVATILALSLCFLPNIPGTLKTEMCKCWDGVSGFGVLIKKGRCELQTVGSSITLYSHTTVYLSWQHFMILLAGGGSLGSRKKRSRKSKGCNWKNTRKKRSCLVRFQIA